MITDKKVSIFIMLMLGVLQYSLGHSAEVHISSISEKRDGAKVEWSNSEAGYAYTLQERNSLTGGSWADVPTRYYWPIGITDWSVLGIDGGPSPDRFFRVVAEPIRAPDRGKFISSELIRRFSVVGVRDTLSSDGVPLDGVQWSVNYYKIIHETVDPYGQSILASGGLFVPQRVTNTMPLLSYQHGTEIYKPWVPSQDDQYWFSRALLFASSGYVTLLPDYLGLGESPGLHPWLHAKTEATAVVDMLRAVKTFCATNDITLNSQLFLTGYSQGGHATAAAHREIEALHADEFTVTASAPMAGPYDMVLSWDYLLGNANYPYPEYIFYVLAAWLPIYDLADTLEEMLAPPYDRTIAPQINGTITFSDTFDAPTLSNAQEALAVDFREAILTEPDHPFWLAAAENNVLDWAPQAPVRLFHCAGDDQVTFENAPVAQQSYTDNGACCVTVIDPTTNGNIWNHSQCFWPSIIGAKEWFDTMKE